MSKSRKQQKIQQVDNALVQTDTMGQNLVEAYNTIREQKMMALDEKTKAALNDYIFGDGENPLEHLQKELLAKEKHAHDGAMALRVRFGSDETVETAEEV